MTKNFSESLLKTRVKNNLEGKTGNTNQLGVYDSVVSKGTLSFNKLDKNEPNEIINIKDLNIHATNNKIETLEDPFIQCSLSLTDLNGEVLSEDICKSLPMKLSEVQQLLSYVKELEELRTVEVKDKQEQRSARIASKISKRQNGLGFLMNRGICSTNGEEWYISSDFQSCIDTDTDYENSPETWTKLNFFLPQHSWVLETWLSDQATSWIVKRYETNQDQGAVYQVSFGFPDETYLESEGKTKEGAIMALAEDILK